MTIKYDDNTVTITNILSCKEGQHKATSLHTNKLSFAEMHMRRVCKRIFASEIKTELLLYQKITA